MAHRKHADEEVEDEFDVQPQDGETEEEDSPVDAIELLQAEHDRLLGLFEAFDAQSDEVQRQQIARHICDALSVHAQLEEEILYPAAQDALDDSRQVEVSLAEHGTAETLVEKIRSLNSTDPAFEAAMATLTVAMEAHIEEEEEELLPLLEESGMDMEALGERLAQRHLELLDEADTE